MLQNKKLLSLMLPLLMPAMISAKSLNNKHLAGPPEEIELMKMAQPEQSALQSRTALLPVSLKQTQSGSWFWESDLAIDSKDYNFMVFANGSKNWQVELINPLNNKASAIEDLATDSVATKYGLEQNNYPGVKHTLTDINPGNWKIRIKSIGEPDQFKGFILASSDSQYLLNSYKTNHDQIAGHDIHFVTNSTSNEQTIEALKSFNPINSAFMVVTSPNGDQYKQAMYDDGLHGDKAANDGLFGGSFKAFDSGDYTVQINATGINPNGTPFYRTTEHFVPVIDQTISMDANKVNAVSIDDNRLNIGIDVENFNKSTNDNRYRIIAEVWGENSKGTMAPVSWISTITNINKGQLNIELDGRWLEMANVSDKYELRNLRIEDAHHFIPLVNKKNIDLNIGHIEKSVNKSFNGLITDEMMMGLRPTDTNNANKAGGKLMLVHGYCSSDVWGPVSGQFSSSTTFADFDQNRSHDEFARLIRDYGDQFSSFGIVAHSQGGAASLHLYTYYWSGLDNSTGSRMIQSVGTPYQGTPLAGNLAALGNVFGAGCGYNSNLTTSGASSWLAGIPTWARNQVNYYTTSFSTKWWRYDYCNIATDLFLSDPEDGVIEKSRGQLSGASNRGHKTGWCHTDGMRDTGQARDSSRNSTMSNYAKR